MLHLHLHLAACCLIVFLSFSLRVSTYIRLQAMFRAASFGGQFARLVARHLYFLFFVIIVLLHLANKLCSVLLLCVSTVDTPGYCWRPIRRPPLPLYVYVCLFVFLVRFFYIFCKAASNVGPYGLFWQPALVRCS